MEFNEYQENAQLTAIYPFDERKTYPLLGLIGEVGEFANKYKKVIRDGREFSQEDVRAELGDCLWYLSALASDFGLRLDDIANANLNKLFGRQNRGVLGGSGDNR